MMKNLKFKAWDYKNNCWISGFSLHNSGMFSDMIKGVINNSGVCVADVNWQNVNDLEDVEIVQWSGLMDRNGNEIYERDIIRDNDGFLWEVCFEDGHFWARGGEFDCYENLDELAPDYCEIFGNVFEMPDWLDWNDDAKE